MARRALISFVVFALTLWNLPFGPATADAASATVVISQVYGGGGNSGAFYKNDFIELYNRGSSAVSLSTWSVQYASAAGSTWQKTNLTGSIAAGAYYLVQEAPGAGGSASLPTPDASGSIPMAAGSGKVALVSNQTALTGTCPTAVVDFVGFGSSANCFEGTGPTGTLNNTTAAIRAAGNVDTDQNATDFAVGPAGPRNSAITDAAPYILSTVPSNGATAVARNANIDITLSEPVSTTGSWFSLSCTASGAHTAALTNTASTLHLDPDADFVFSESCTVTVTAALVTDVDPNDPPDALVQGLTWSFSVAGPPVPGALRIHDIQGAGHISPFKGSSVTNVPGIVTGRQPNGFYMQDPTPDTDDATSEGIFVFTSSAPTVTVGDSVVVSASVSEFRPGGSSTGNLTTTELSGPTVVVIASGNALPAPIHIGTDRVPPTQVIEDDSTTGNVETNDTFDPASDGIDFWESLEGMRVDLGTAAVVGPSNKFGEISVLADGGAGATGRTARGGIKIGATDKNPERVIVKGVGFDMPGDLNVGDALSGPVVGVVDYNFGNFMIQVFTPPTAVHNGLAREITAATGPHELAVATFNVENLSPADPQSKFDTLAALIVNNLRAPDVISLEEVQDNNGASVDDGTVDATQTLTTLRDAIVAAGGPTYQWREIDPVNDQDGGAPGGNIRQVFFFRTDRGAAFVDRPGGDSTTANSVVNAGGEPQLQFSPGRIQPTDAAFNSSRKPLAAEFTYNGHHLFVIANHWNSKGGDEPLWGKDQPPVLSSETQRMLQAAIVRDFTAGILAVDPSAEVVVLGDLNDFEFSNPVLRLKEAPLNDLIETLPENERYTYVFEGNSQTLDHILVSDSLLAQHARTDVVHVNSEFWDQASDHEPQVATLPLLDATPPSITATQTPAPNGYGWNDTNVTVTFSCADNVGVASCVGDTTLTAETAGQAVTGTATDLSGNTASATVTVRIDKTAPTFTWSGSLTYTVDQTVAITCAITDSLSGLDAATASHCDGASGPAVTFGLGSHTLTAAATDRAGNASSATTTFAVTVTSASLCTLTKSAVTNSGEANSLCVKLDAAAAAATRGNTNAHDNQIQAFVNEVKAQTGKAITDADAAILIALAGGL